MSPEPGKGRTVEVNVRALFAMDAERRRQLAEEALGGYASGPDAPLVASADALAKAAFATTVILVEGISDQIALETLAERHGRDLETEGIVIVPIGGAQAAPREFARFGPSGEGLKVCGLCDIAEESFFLRGLTEAGIGAPETREETETLGVFVCDSDLEDELIRAAGQHRIEALLESQGDLVSFRTLQKQPAWVDRSFAPQMHRWLRAGARRNLRYARLLVLSLPLDHVPHPLGALLETAGRKYSR